jgi:hypothetical protein
VLDSVLLGIGNTRTKTTIPGFRIIHSLLREVHGSVIALEFGKYRRCTDRETVIQREIPNLLLGEGCRKGSDPGRC